MTMYSVSIFFLLLSIIYCICFPEYSALVVVPTAVKLSKRYSISPHCETLVGTCNNNPTYHQYSVLLSSIMTSDYICLF